MKQNSEKIYKIKININTIKNNYQKIKLGMQQIIN